jgi:hypothetical protein
MYEQPGINLSVNTSTQENRNWLIWLFTLQSFWRSCKMNVWLCIFWLHGVETV